MISQKPFFIRALHEWCESNDLTPHTLVFVDNHTVVPQEYVQNKQIVLNTSASACKNLTISNETITFQARFSGVVYDIYIPIGNVLAVFAKENAQGMQFELESYLAPTETKTDKPKFSGLKLVK